jgi:hypothetical protein
VLDRSATGVDAAIALADYCKVLSHSSSRSGSGAVLPTSRGAIVPATKTVLQPKCPLGTTALSGGH